MDDQGQGAVTPPENTTNPAPNMPEIPVVDNTQPAPESTPEPASTPAEAPAEPPAETSAGPSAENPAEAPAETSTPEIPVIDGTAPVETPASDSPAPAPEPPVKTPTDTPSGSSPEPSSAPILSGTPRSLGGAPSGSTEAGGPAAFGSSAITSKPKSKLLPVLVSLILLLGVGGAAGAFFFLRPVKTDTPDLSADQTPSDTSGESLSRYSLNSNSLSDFDLAFLRLEGEGKNASKNKIYSPLSIKYALAMLADASAGDSKTQITSLIGSYSPKAYLNSANRSLANALFLRTDFANMVKPSYTDLLSEKYAASVITDSFETPDVPNTWIANNTLGILKNVLDSSTVNPETDYLLVNALAIDMAWKNKLQCAMEPSDAIADIPCKPYSVYYPHEKYADSVSPDEFAHATFAGTENVESAKIAISANRYDIIKELGEDKIRETVTADYEKFLTDALAATRSEDTASAGAALREEMRADLEAQLAEKDSFIDNYISELGSAYGSYDDSTDFSYSDTETERIFAKDLQEYDGVTLEYVGIMPKNTSIKSYLSSTSASALSAKLSSLTTPTLDSFKDGVITKLNATIPFFHYDYDLDLLSDLEALGVTDVFSGELADLTGMLDINLDEVSTRPHIDTAVHKADINFSNNGIKAAAVTAIGGKGAGGDWDYLWDVPVEEIDLSFDQPFFFLIRDKASGEVWFTGEVNSLPAAS